MASCAYCGSNIFSGGVRAGNARYCNQDCLQRAQIRDNALRVPPGTVVPGFSPDDFERQVQEIWTGSCPKCRGRCPVDVHKYHEVWSAVVLTRWTTKSQVSCRSCATKRQLAGAGLSLVLGWWGFPWGLILTPVQIGRNLVGICRGPDPARPSGELRDVLRGLQMRRAAAAPRPPVRTQPPPLPPPLPMS